MTLRRSLAVRLRAWVYRLDPSLLSPEPDEPLGLDAVVEAGGYQWVRGIATHDSRPWWCERGFPHASWAELPHPIRALSEGSAQYVDDPR